MKTDLILKHITIALCLMFVGFEFSCTPQAAIGNSSDAASLGALSVTPSSTSVSPGTQAQVMASGGVSPYTFTIISGSGSIYSSGATTGIYTAPASGSGLVEIQVTDSKGTAALTGISIAGGALLITPQNQSLTFGASANLQVTGGTGPYYFSIGSATQGTLGTQGSSSTGTNTFKAGYIAQTVLVTVTDSSVPANTGSTYVFVSGINGQTGLCSGTFSINENGQPGIMSLMEDSNGNISGQISLYNGTLQSVNPGTCSSSQIAFTVNGVAPFTAGITLNSGSTGHISFSGTYISNGNTYGWSGNN